MGYKRRKKANNAKRWPSTQGSCSRRRPADAGNAMPEWNASAVTEFLKAVAHETRLQIVRLLYLHPQEEMSAGVISVELEVPPNLLSFHLKELVVVGVISKNVSGRNVFYAVTPRTRKFVHIFRDEFGIRKAADDEVWTTVWSELKTR